MIGSPLRRIRSFFRSLAGHIFLLLTVGMSLAAILALVVAERSRSRDFARWRIQRVVASAEDIAGRLQRDPKKMEQLLASHQILGATAVPPGIGVTEPDTQMAQALAERFGPKSQPEASQVPFGFCYPNIRFTPVNRAAGLRDAPKPDCWIVRFTDSSGARRSMALTLPRMVRPESALSSRFYLLLILLSSASLAIIVARIVTKPLRRLEHAAEAFSVSLDPEDIPESGPAEVRAALATFNLMQQRVRAGFARRTELLAAISHDLQTPLTRLRLRLELVENEELRARLLQDHHAMLTLVREGLDLAASTETQEEWSIIDIDSLLISMVEDAQDLGAPLRFTGGCGRAVRVKVNALTRCIGNLVDNAIKYGGSAEIGCSRRGGRVLIHVRDRGPGIPSDQLDQMFEPFTRGAAGQPGGRPGTGIGLTIARSLALTFGGSVRLVNAEDGGLVAIIEMKA